MKCYVAFAVLVSSCVTQKHDFGERCARHCDYSMATCMNLESKSYSNSLHCELNYDGCISSCASEP